MNNNGNQIGCKVFKECCLLAYKLSKSMPEYYKWADNAHKKYDELEPGDRLVHFKELLGRLKIKLKERKHRQNEQT